MKSYLVGEKGSRIRITTNVNLGEGSKSMNRLPHYTTLPKEKHYVFCPGRADHADKYVHFMELFAEKGHSVWCIDPYAQGGSEGGLPCEAHEKESDEPCCARKGHGTWEAYTQTYIAGLSAIYECLSYGESIRKDNVIISPDLTIIAHSMMANVDMWARLDADHRQNLKRYISEIHYIAPMVSHTLLLKRYIGGFGEEMVRYVLSWVVQGLNKLGYHNNYFIAAGGPINPHKLTERDVRDKIHPSKVDQFIQVCRQNSAHEIGMITNLWFLEAHRACQAIKDIKHSDYRPDRKVYVHIPLEDQVVYPEWVEAFFEQHLPHKYQPFYYEGEPHNLFWGSEKGIEKFIENILEENGESSHINE